MAKSVVGKITLGRFPATCGYEIINLVYMLLVAIISLNVVKANSQDHYENIIQINEDIASIFFSEKSDQSSLKIFSGPIYVPSIEGSAIDRERSGKVKEVSLSNNQGLLSLFSENHIGDEDAYEILDVLSEYLDVNAVAVGRKFRLIFDEQSQLQSIRVKLAFAESLEVKRTDQGFIAVRHKNPTALQYHYVEGEIVGSLYNTGLRLGLSNAVLVRLNEILSYEVDFQREIHSGDRFSVFYSTLRDNLDGSENFHSINFTALSLGSKATSLYRYQFDKSGRVDYFHPNGKSSRSFLMKTPLENARLSSYYGRRKHPVLGYTRMHNGLDFGAPLGTPILAAGDGTVERASYFGSFGNYIRIGHRSGIQTIYAHLKGYAKGIKAGVTVEQGQLIGYLGATGRVQGRHLHYEIHKNGKAIDPLRLDLPASDHLSGAMLKLFENHVEKTDRELRFHRKSAALTGKSLR
ncbi:M23 family metallopeptidase [Microbulbifer sp. GL-2]|uniref:M23 family metallopeptidase n=1 Tax=Microbulbifer sp. GL-2 TaxID=2591606 RepID=UPI0011626B08|nr:M23 family metallopeptidase [Microbulbifer sp. GL-2]BBM03305.1 hypothetical protein GL2_33790 [Microbulbifer sp. GL-2]